MTKKIIITGIVQGVGFRPFIYKLAKELNVKGTVANTSQGVVVEANFYDEKHLEKFLKRVEREKPPNSKIDKITVEKTEDRIFKDFFIIESKSGFKKNAKIPSDLALCDDCVKDIFNEDDRRYLYPFTNCTNCGPRFTITKKIPYDRKNTSMKFFEMCKSCEDEYKDPLNRRFHAQPNACPLCGPEVWVVYRKRRIDGIKSLSFLAERIIKGDIVLIKGIGGFHMACDAFNLRSIKRLREIKKREFKPLAIMVDNISDIEEFVYIKPKEYEILSSQIAPIVMLEKKNINYFSGVAPLIDSVGVMVAYTPLHKILFKILKDKGFNNPLVMTSGNFKDEPIIIDNNDAVKKFDKLAVLCHNRDIINRVDDSVGFVDLTNTFRLIRRSRGYVPNSIKIGIKAKEEIFACGGDIKNVFAFAREDEVFLSQYIGDLDNEENAKYFVESFYNLKKLYDFKPKVMLLDLHPYYKTREISKRFNIEKKVFIQHHIAHVYSVMAENQIRNNVLAFSFDGTGYGLDGKIWGGEIFLIKNKKIYRIGHLEKFFLFGGDNSIKDIWKIFVSAFLKNQSFIFDVLKNKIDKKNIEIAIKVCENKINGSFTTSFGRLFDAISVVALGLTNIDFEAEAPMKLESSIIKDLKSSYKFGVLKDKGYYVFSFSNFIEELINDFFKSRDIISTKFHNSVVNVIVDFVNMLRKEENIENIVFCGGVFQNRYLLNNLLEKLSLDFNIYANKETPVNDGCISLGQIYYYLTGDDFVL